MKCVFRGSDEVDVVAKRAKPTYSVPELSPAKQLEIDHPGNDGPMFENGNYHLSFSEC